MFVHAVTAEEVVLFFCVQHRNEKKKEKKKRTHFRQTRKRMVLILWINVSVFLQVHLSSIRLFIKQVLIFTKQFLLKVHKCNYC